MPNWKNWKKEFARDTLALGSIPMFIIVLARTTVGKYYQITYQILLAALILFLLFLIFKSQPPQLHIARAIILFIFTSLFYYQKIYTTFASVLLLLLLISLFYLKYETKKIILGIILGLISSGISWYLISLFDL